MISSFVTVAGALLDGMSSWTNAAGLLHTAFDLELLEVMRQPQGPLRERVVGTIRCVARRELAERVQMLQAGMRVIVVGHLSSARGNGPDLLVSDVGPSLLPQRATTTSTTKGDA